MLPGYLWLFPRPPCKSAWVPAADNLFLANPCAASHSLECDQWPIIYTQVSRKPEKFSCQRAGMVLRGWVTKAPSTSQCHVLRSEWKIQRWEGRQNKMKGRKIQKGLLQPGFYANRRLHLKQNSLNLLQGHSINFAKRNIFLPRAHRSNPAVQHLLSMKAAFWQRNTPNCRCTFSVWVIKLSLQYPNTRPPWTWKVLLLIQKYRLYRWRASLWSRKAKSSPHHPTFHLVCLSLAPAKSKVSTASLRGKDLLEQGRKKRQTNHVFILLSVRDLNISGFSTKSHVPSALLTQPLSLSKISSSVNRMLSRRFTWTMLVLWIMLTTRERKK